MRGFAGSAASWGTFANFPLNGSRQRAGRSCKARSAIVVGIRSKPSSKKRHVCPGLLVTARNRLHKEVGCNAGRGEPACRAAVLDLFGWRMPDCRFHYGLMTRPPRSPVEPHPARVAVTSHRSLGPVPPSPLFRNRVNRTCRIFRSLRFPSPRRVSTRCNSIVRARTNPDLTLVPNLLMDRTIKKFFLIT